MPKDNKQTLADALAGRMIGRVAFNKCIVGDRVYITAYDPDMDGLTDEQLSFTPDELVEFCQEVLRCAQAGGCDHSWTTRPVYGGYRRSCILCTRMEDILHQEGGPALKIVVREGNNKYYGRPSEVVNN